MTIISDAAEHIKNCEVEITAITKNRIIIQVKDHIVIWEKRK